MCRKSIQVSLFTMMLSLSGPAISQEMVLTPPGLSAQTVTRDVAEYTLLEQQLVVLINNGNKDGALLADDFEVWSDKGNDWQSKEDWLKSSKQLANANIRNLSVRLMDDFSVVSFLLETTKGRHKKQSIQFVVDIWRKSTHKLSVRYVSDLVSSPSASTWQNRRF